MLAFMSGATYAQVTGGGNAGSSQNTGGNKSLKGYLYVAPSIPTGDYADETNGCAKTGFALGYDLLVGSKNVKFVWNQVINYNGANYSTSYTDEYGYLRSLELSWGYLNWGENIGLRVQGTSGKIDVYGTLLAGVNLCLLTGDLSDYSTGYAFDYGLGGGVLINDRFNIGLRYTGMKSTFTMDDGSNSFEQKMPMIHLTLGFEFR